MLTSRQTKRAMNDFKRGVAFEELVFRYTTRTNKSKKAVQAFLLVLLKPLKVQVNIEPQIRKFKTLEGKTVAYYDCEDDYGTLPAYTWQQLAQENPTYNPNKNYFLY